MSFFELYDYYRYVVWSSDNEFISNDYISDIDFYLYNLLDENKKLEINDIDGYFSLIVTFRDPNILPKIANQVFNILQKKITELKIKSYELILEDAKNNLSEKKIEFDEIQTRVADFKDKNQTVSSKRFNNQLFMLENEFNLKYADYTELLNKVEEAKLEISKNTPLFMIIKEPTIPKTRFYPKRKQIVVLWTFIGFVISFLFIQFKTYLKLISEKNKNTKNN